MSKSAMQRGLPIGVALGISIGVALGMSLGNLGLIGAGLAIGIGLAPTFGKAMILKESGNADDTEKKES